MPRCPRRASIFVVLPQRQSDSETSGADLEVPSLFALRRMAAYSDSATTVQ
jgi:hypothetical protein